MVANPLRESLKASSEPAVSDLIDLEARGDVLAVRLADVNLQESEASYALQEIFKNFPEGPVIVNLSNVSNITDEFVSALIALKGQSGREIILTDLSESALQKIQRMRLNPLVVSLEETENDALVRLGITFTPVDTGRAEKVMEDLQNSLDAYRGRLNTAGKIDIDLADYNAARPEREVLNVSYKDFATVIGFNVEKIRESGFVSNRIRDEILNLVNNHKSFNVIIDLEGVDFIGADTVGVIAAASQILKKSGSSLGLCNVSDAVMNKLRPV
ncbi:MAG: STAS domain-containing protein, partial [Candidatus Dadabacteria bacterium]